MRKLSNNLFSNPYLHSKKMMDALFLFAKGDWHTTIGASPTITIMKRSPILCLLILIFMGCKDDNEPAIQLLVNTDMEAGTTSPNSWFQRGETVYRTEWTTEEANSGTRSLKISATQIDATDFAFWGQSYFGAIPIGKDVVLSIKVKCKDVIGEGISIAIRGDNANSIDTAAQFSTTQDTINITGDFDWTTYQVRLNGIKRDIKSLSIYFVFLNNTVGTVYFDDASLIIQ